MFVHAPDFELADRMPCALVRLWLLRFLVLLDGHHRFITSAGLTCNAIERALGMTVVPSQESGATFDVEAARAELRALHAAAETQAANDGPPHVLKGNIARVQTLVGLTPGAKNPYFDGQQVVEFNKAYVSWRMATAAKRLRGVPYQKPGHCHRGEAAPKLEKETAKYLAGEGDAEE